MLDAIGEVLSEAIGVAISPIPIIAVILILFSKKARSNGPAFLAGWVVALCAICAIVMLVGGAADIGTSSGPSKGASVFRIVLGALLLFAAWRQWKKRPAEGEEPHMPKWMAGIEDFTTARSFVVAVGLSGLNPKNLALTIAAAMSVSQANLSTAEALVPLAVFVAIASSTVALMVFIYLLGGEKAARLLDSWKAWLTANNTAVMSVLFLVFGVTLIGKGIAGL